MKKGPTQVIVASVVILGVVLWLTLTGIGASKDYYVTIAQLQSMGGKAYTRHLRVAGNVAPGSIQRVGTNAHFTLIEEGKKLDVAYQGMEPPPDTFKDDAQALAIGTYGRDGVFHATQLQAKCASKYAPAKDGAAVPGKTAALVMPR
jgi:cytochrome c-type biogenesis protein CcmE